MKELEFPLKGFENDMLTQGATLLTEQTKGWTKEQWGTNEAEERCMVFADFRAWDKGKSRRFVVKCKSSKIAAEVVEKHNKEVREKKK